MSNSFFDNILAQSIFNIFSNKNLFIYIVSRKVTIICMFTLPLLFFLFLFFARILPKYKDYSSQTKNIIKKMLLIDMKKVVPNYYLICNAIAFFSFILLLIADTVHIIFFNGITSGILRISVFIYFIAILIQSGGLFKYQFMKK